MLGQAVGDFTDASSRDPNSVGLNVDQRPDAVVLLLHDPGMVVVLQFLRLAFVEVSPVLQQHRHDLPRQCLPGMFAFPVMPLKCGDERFFAGASAAWDAESQRHAFGLEVGEVLHESVPWEV
jgi:hypothetical protein